MWEEWTIELTDVIIPRLVGLYTDRQEDVSVLPGVFDVWEESTLHGSSLIKEAQLQPDDSQDLVVEQSKGPMIFHLHYPPKEL